MSAELAVVEMTYAWLCPNCGQTEVKDKDTVCQHCQDLQGEFA